MSPMKVLEDRANVLMTRIAETKNSLEQVIQRQADLMNFIAADEAELVAFEAAILRLDSPEENA